MILAEKHIIKKTHKFYKELDELSFSSKNLYNYANFLVRKEFIESTKLKKDNIIDHANYLNYYAINRLLIDTDQIDYCKLPRKVSNQVLMLLDKNWKSFFKSIKDWNTNKSKYLGKPSLPKYKHKTKGRNVLVYELGSISKISLKQGIIKLSQTNIEIPFINKENKLKQVRIVPQNNNYVIEIIYEKEEIDLGLDKDNKLGIDLGLNNLMALTSNIGIKPILINGRPLKSMNQYYNKKLSLYKSELPKGIYTSNKIKELTNRRNNKINDYIHKTSKFVVDFCTVKDIGTIIIGKNKNWKNEINNGKVNNQNFVSVPINKLINQIIYKAMLIGIEVILTEESYTSKSSFLNLDNIPVYDKNNKIKHKFSGYRESRGMYKIKGSKIRINSDVNGSYNIIRKAFPNEFMDGIEGVAVHPERVISSKDYHRFLC